MGARGNAVFHNALAVVTQGRTPLKESASRVHLKFLLIGPALTHLIETDIDLVGIAGQWTESGRNYV